MNAGFAPDLTPFVVAFVVLDVLAALMVVGLAATAATTFLARHRAVRVRRHERLLPYYGHLTRGLLPGHFPGHLTPGR